MASIDYGNAEVVNASLEEALSWCTGFESEQNKVAVINNVFNALEMASSMVRKPGKKSNRHELTRLTIFQGLLNYYMAKLRSSPADVKEFFGKILPSIINLAMKDENDQTVILPRNLQEQRYLSPSNSTTQMTVFEVKIERTNIAIALARMFLCLMVPSTDYEFAERPDYCRFYSGLNGNNPNAQEGKYLMVLQYFRHILNNGVPPGSIIYSKLIGQLSHYAPRNMEKWSQVNDVLCEFVVKSRGSIDDMPAEVLQTDFANHMFGGSTLGLGAIQEEIMLCACPELQVAMLFISRIRTLEAVQIKGHQQFSRYTGYAGRMRFAGPYVAPQSGARNTSPSYMTAIDAFAFRGDPEPQYQLKYMCRDMNKALVGFTQPYSERTDDLDVPTVSTDRRRTSEDLAAIGRYAESLTEKLMKDIVSELRLVIPDYFGFNVIHYDPLKEEPMITDEQDSPRVTNVAPDLSAKLVPTSPVQADTRPKSTYTRSSQSNDTITREYDSIAHDLTEYASDLSSQIVKESLDTLHKMTFKPPEVTEQGDSNARPRLEVTTKTSGSPIPISVDVNVSVTRGSKSVVVYPQSSQSIPMEVDITAAAGDNQHIDVNADVMNSPAPNIDIQIVVTPNTDPLPAAQAGAGANIADVTNGAECSTSNKTATESVEQVTVDRRLSALSVSDSIKHELSRRAQRMAEDILCSVYDELRERRRLFIENNISSVELDAAKRMSAGVIGQIFEELQTEAENSIPDSEKLLKDNQIETLAESMVTSVVTELHTERSPQISTHNIVSSSGSQSMLSPHSARRRSQSTLSPTTYKDWCGQRKLNRRSSAPVAVRRASLESITRRVSEPNVSFRSRSPHSDFGAKLSDYIRQEFCPDRRGTSNSSLSSSGSKSAADHLWAEFNRRSSDDSKTATLSPSMRSPKSDSRSHSSHQTLPSCEEEEDDLTSSTDGLLLTVADSSIIQRQVSLVLPAITVDQPGSSGICRSSSQEAVESNVRSELSSQDSERASPLLSPLEHQYLRLYSEVLAENILHESLGNMQQSIDQSQSGRLAEVAEEEENAGDDEESHTAAIRPVATGNWGCGAFGGDPQLKSLMQWVAASKAKCPQIIYYTFGDQRVDELVQIIRYLQSKRVKDIVALLIEYSDKRIARRNVGTVFDFIKVKEGWQ